ncbi:UDP-glucose 4-epimerase family protein [Bacterioplanoides sp.]|uniref:UDP-glucose 4-epimerase family protein n=1 Tax=Bacterioplanoides sp. TaxID=2066072 RepID=UPI003B59EEBD
MKVLLTGANGFLGTSISEQLDIRNYGFIPMVRKINKYSPKNARAVGNIDSNTDFSEVLPSIDVVIHAAARAHIMEEEVADPLTEYRKINVAGSENLARQAAVAGVKRFIFISSVKVSGESTSGKNAYNESMAAAPEDAYGQSKYEAEEALKRIAAETGIELVIIRPPLVYGPGVKANFLSLFKLCKLSVPLPFALVNNQRSMVYLENLVDFIIQCVDHPNAANQTFFISDGKDLSLSYLIRTIRKAINKPALLFPVPVWLFKLAGRLIGKTAVMDRLVGNLQVDSTKAQQLLAWRPPCTIEEGIKATVADINSRK